MHSNRGATTLKSRRRSADPMQDYDRLPQELRHWMAGALLPWGPQSVRQAYTKALARTRCQKAALAELDRVQLALVTKDSRRIWGETYPTAT